MADDIKKESNERLSKMLSDKREALRVFRFEGAGSRSRNVREGRGYRKDIARILTELSARNVSAQAGIASKHKSA